MTGLFRDAQDLDTGGQMMMRRFGIEVVDVDFAAARLALSMPMSGMDNPFTGERSVAPLAILLDVAGGVANHFQRPSGHWTVTTELSLEVSPEHSPPRVLADGQTPVLAEARPFGSTGSSP